MKLTVLGCYQVVNYIPSDNSAIIRIGDTKDEFEELKGNYEKKLELCFYDIYPSPHVPSNFNEFRKKDFNEIVKFFKEIETEETDELVIHCHAGVSRSPAWQLCIHGLIMTKNY